MSFEEANDRLAGGERGLFVHAAFDQSDPGGVVEIVGSRVGIVGGSIAGRAAAIALWRVGCEVLVFERESQRAAWGFCRSGSAI